jgi:DeoR family transcriptional regulator, suf operon transcriptional repressor
MGAPLPLALPQGHPGRKGHRSVVLAQLKRAGHLTVKALAQRLGLSVNAVRHHLKELEADGLVVYERERRGVGAPAFSYGLTSNGEALFPRRYEATLTALLDRMVEHGGREAAVSLLESRFADLSRRLCAELEGRPPAERLEALGRALSEEGYMAEVAQGAGVATVTEHNCAIPAVAERFPEICAAEARFMAEVLGAEVHRQAHMLAGCNACEYHVRFHAAQEKA